MTDQNFEQLKSTVPQDENIKQIKNREQRNGNPYTNTIVTFEKNIDKLKLHPKKHAFDHTRSIDQGRPQFKSETEFTLPSINESSQSSINQISKTMMKVMDYIQANEQNQKAYVLEFRELKGQIKLLNSSLKRIDSMSDQVTFIYNLLNIEMNSNSNLLKEMEVVKKQHEKVQTKLGIIATDLKKADASIGEMMKVPNKDIKGRSLSNADLESIQSRAVMNPSLEQDTKTIKSIWNLLSCNFHQNQNDSEKISDRIAKIETKQNSIEKFTEEKLNKYEKATENLIYQINNINKYIRDQRTELDLIKELMKSNKDKLSQDLFKNIENLMTRFESNFNQMFDNNDTFLTLLKKNISNTEVLMDYKFEYNIINDHSDNIYDKISMDSNNNLEIFHKKLIELEEKCNLQLIDHIDANLTSNHHFIINNTKYIVENITKGSNIINENLKITKELKDDISMEKINTNFLKASTQEDENFKNLKEVLESHQNDDEKNQRHMLVKFQEIYKELEGNSRILQIGFDEMRVNNKDSSKMHSQVQTNTLLIPKLKDNGSNVVVDKIDMIAAKINSLTNNINTNIQKK